MARTATRKKKLHQTNQDLPKEESVTAVTPTRQNGVSAGPLAVAMEGGVRQLRQELDESHELLRAHQTAQETAAAQGWILLSLDASQIVDEVKSDRKQELGSEEDYQTLRDDIEKRGQRTPIRVRPADPDWTPDPIAPNRSIEQFFLQSGRRRLAVCRELGVPVLAIVTAVTPENTDARLDDLIERFAENTIRADLTGFEQYLSIGEVASHLKGWTQSAVANLLGTKREEVSVAQSVWEYEDDLISMMGEEVTKFSKRQVRPLIKKVKNWIEDGRPDVSSKNKKKEPVKAVREQGRVDLSNGLTVSASRTGAFKVELEDGSKPSSEQVEFILDAIAKGAGRVT